MTQEKKYIYYHELSQTVKEYLSQEGVIRGMTNLMAMLYCASLDVQKEEKEKEEKFNATLCL